MASPNREGVSQSSSTLTAPPSPPLRVTVDPSRCPITGGLKVPIETDPGLVHFRMELSTTVEAVIPPSVIAARSMYQKKNSVPSGGDALMGNTGPTQLTEEGKQATSGSDRLELWQFSQWQSLASVDKLWEELNASFRGYVLPPLSCRPVTYFSETRQQLWMVHYALRSLSFANDGSMALMEPFVRFLLRGKDIPAADVAAALPPLASSSPPPSSSSMSPTNHRSKGTAMEEESPPPAVSEISSPSNSFQLITSADFASSGGGSGSASTKENATSNEAEVPSKPANRNGNRTVDSTTVKVNPNGASNQMRSHANINSTLHRRDYETMHSLSLKLQGLTKPTGLRKFHNPPAPVPSGREGFVEYITKRISAWQRVAAETTHLAGMVVRFAQEHEKRCQGHRMDVKAVKGLIGRPRIHDHELVLGGRVENVNGIQGTILYLSREGGEASDSTNVSSRSPPPLSLVGVCWDVDGVGHCDGSYHGRKYFHCGPRQGAFVNPQNLFSPVDEDDILHTLCEAVSAVDALLHPTHEVGVANAVGEVGCQLATALQFHASFYQAFANSASELLSIHKALTQGEVWVAAEAKKRGATVGGSMNTNSFASNGSGTSTGTSSNPSSPLSSANNRGGGGSPMGSKELEARKLVEALCGEWWVATRAFSDGVLSFQDGFEAHRLEIATLYGKMHACSDLASWGDWSAIPSIAKEALDPTEDLKALTRVFRLARVD